MREGRIILPTRDNAGVLIDKAHLLIKRRLATEFGGYTSTGINGGWLDPRTAVLHEEPGIAYDVAMDEDASASHTLLELARDVLPLANQEAVYVRYPNGEVEIVEAAHRKAHAA